MLDAQIPVQFAFHTEIANICELNWRHLDRSEVVDTAWAYYFFSVQFRENLQVARELYPEDEKLRELEHEECNTNNLSPWPGVALPGERMDHDEFMRRVLTLAPIPAEKRIAFEALGNAYLRSVRATDPVTRALSITSYEDGGLEQVFRAMLTAPAWDDALLAGFRHFLSEHIRFDSDPTKGHGAMIRHLQPDDRILPLWASFRELLVSFVPNLARCGADASVTAQVPHLSPAG